MADRDVARRARAYIRELREALDGDAEADSPSTIRAPAFLRDRPRPPRREPRAGELWMAFPSGKGLPTPVALVSASPFVVVPMTREVWLADDRDPLLQASESPTGEWLAALLPGATTARPEFLRSPVGGLPESLVAVLRRLFDAPDETRVAHGPVPLPAADTDVLRPSHATSWSMDGEGGEPWLAGLPLCPGDARFEARRLHLESIAWLGEPADAPVRPGVLERLRTALADWCEWMTESPWEGVSFGAVAAPPGPTRAAEHRVRLPPIEGAIRLGDTAVELSFEPVENCLRVTLLATTQGRPAPGVRLCIDAIRSDGSRTHIERFTGDEGLVAGLVLSLDEGMRHELAVEAGGHRRQLSF